MNDKPAEYRAAGWWGTVRRRKVVEWSLAYAAGAWGLLQGLQFLAQVYGWPTEVLRFVTLAFALGLPLVLVLAWYHGDRGEQRVKGPEIMIIVLLFLVGGGIFWRYDRTSETTPAPTAPATATATDTSIAVLPFVNMSADKEQEYFADGIAEELLNLLAQVPGLRVIARTSSFSFKGKNVEIAEIARRLHVANVLEGSVRRSGERIRVTAQLVRASDSSHLWSKTYDRNLTDVFAVQEEIARDVAQALSVKLDVVTLNRAQGGTTNIDAYDRYLRWRQLVFSDAWDAEHDRQRVQMAREAVALDPGFVLAWDALADSLNDLAGEVGGSQAEQLRAEAAQVRARILELAPGSLTVKRERAYQLWREGQRANAIALAREIMESGPLTYEHAFPYINLIFAVGHLDETVALVEQLRAIEPLSMFLSRDLQFDYIAARRYDQAEAEYRRSLALEGSHLEPTFVALMRALARERADVGALRELHRRMLNELEDPDPPFFRDLGAVLHDRAAMLAILRRAAADPVYRSGDASLFLQLHLADALGDADLAAAVLRDILELRADFKQGRMPYGDYFVLWTAPYSGLRAHPDFKRLLIETGVAEYWRQTGKWGDGCRPLGADNFKCQ